MIPLERHKEILKILKLQDSISIKSLARILSVSHMTIRRDLQLLERQGKIRNIAGGVEIAYNEKISVELSHHNKIILNKEEKRAIGNEAVKYIEKDFTVFLDAGTTTLEIAKSIINREDLLIITNDLVIATFLSTYGQGRIFHTGGNIFKDNYSSMGLLSTKIIKDFSIDIAFISNSSWNLKGLTTPYEEKIHLKRAVIDVSRKNILVADSTKYGKFATFFILPLEKFHLIITDKNLDLEVVDKITSMGIKCYLA